MEELFNLTYKDEVQALKDEEEFEALGDERYIKHEDMEARLYWAFCRPSGSHPDQIADAHPLVSIMAFNHSRLPALKRFRLLHADVISDEALRKKIRNRTRMLFRDLVDNDFVELNKVLDLVPVFIDVAIHQLIHGRKWNDIPAKDIEASKFLSRVKSYDEEMIEALKVKLQDFEEFDVGELKAFLAQKIEEKEAINLLILEHYQIKAKEWLEESGLHILQKKGIESLIKKF
ncbi:MAG: hypothetical protein U9N49_09440 [Campylobacterota bacterium]|nr:hypothetical protein [Campylobacterota bacterium]